METEDNLIASTKLNPFPAWLVLRVMDETTRKERNADGLASRNGEVLTIELYSKLTRREAIIVLAHEIEHILEMLEDVIEDSLRGEFRAYMMGWIMEWCYDAFCARKRK